MSSPNFSRPTPDVTLNSEDLPPRNFYGLTKNEFFDRLKASSKKKENLGATEILTKARYDLLKGISRNDFNAQKILDDTLSKISFSLALGERLLTGNSIAYHKYNDAEPSQALLALKQIIESAGFSCSIETQINIRANKNSKQINQILIVLQEMNAIPSDFDRTFFTLPSDRITNETLDNLAKFRRYGITTELWPALVQDLAPKKQIS